MPFILTLIGKDQSKYMYVYNKSDLVKCAERISAVLESEALSSSRCIDGFKLEFAQKIYSEEKKNDR